MTEEEQPGVSLPYPGFRRLVLAFLSFQALHAPAFSFGNQTDTVSAALRLDPMEVVVSDLEDFIPQIMARYGIPGLSIALIRDHRIVWEKSFGVANTLTRKPLTPETSLP